MIRWFKSDRPNPALGLLSLAAVFLVTVVNLYYSSKLGVGVGYVASHYELRCGGLIHLAFLGTALPFIFLLVGISAIGQIVLFAAFHFSIALISLHILHGAFLGFLFVLGNSYCDGTDLGSSLFLLSNTILFGIILTALPMPLMIWQIHEIKRNRNLNS